MTSRFEAQAIKSDDQLREEFFAYLKKRPYASRNEIRLALKTTVDRMERMGLPLPPKLSPSCAAHIARKKGGWGKNFKLRGSPK